MKKEDLKKLAQTLNEDDRKMLLEDIEMDEVTNIDLLGNETVVGFITDNWKRYFTEKRDPWMRKPMDIAIEKAKLEEAKAGREKKIKEILDN